MTRRGYNGTLSWDERVQLIDRLRTATATYRTATGDRTAARAARDEAIRAARAGGWTYDDLYLRTGLSSAIINRAMHPAA